MHYGNLLNITDEPWTRVSDIPGDAGNEVLTHHIIPPSTLSCLQNCLSMDHLEQQAAAVFFCKPHYDVIG